MSDGWGGYLWASDINSGLRHYIHVHGRRDFGFAQESTSHMESVWSQVKTEIKSTYKMIPSTNLLYFIREAEWKIKKKI